MVVSGKSRLKTRGQLDVDRYMYTDLNSKHIKDHYTIITKTCPCNIQKIVGCKNNKKKNTGKNFDVFLIFFSQNIECGYMLEPPRRGGSNECPQSTCMFWIKNKKNMYTPANHSFTI